MDVTIRHLKELAAQERHGSRCGCTVCATQAIAKQALKIIPEDWVERYPEFKVRFK